MTRVPCTGITARWCPACGECCCAGDDLDDPRCPLHSVVSAHGEGDDMKTTTLLEVMAEVGALVRRLADRNGGVTASEARDTALAALTKSAVAVGERKGQLLLRAAAWSIVALHVHGEETSDSSPTILQIADAIAALHAHDAEAAKEGVR